MPWFLWPDCPVTLWFLHNLELKSIKYFRRISAMCISNGVGQNKKKDDVERMYIVCMNEVFGQLFNFPLKVKLSLPGSDDWRVAIVKDSRNESTRTIFSILSFWSWWQKKNDVLHRLTTIFYTDIFLENNLWSDTWCFRDSHLVQLNKCSLFPRTLQRCCCQTSILHRALDFLCAPEFRVQSAQWEILNIFA